MSNHEQPYNVATIHKLLLAAFTPEDLRRFCQDRTPFRPILDNFGPKYNLNDMIYEVIDYCRTQLLWDELLVAVKEENPRQYARFYSELGESAHSPPLLPKTRRPDPSSRIPWYRIAIAVGLLVLMLSAVLVVVRFMLFEPTLTPEPTEIAVILTTATIEPEPTDTLAALLTPTDTPTPTDTATPTNTPSPTLMPNMPREAGTNTSTAMSTPVPTPTGAETGIPTSTPTHVPVSGEVYLLLRWHLGDESYGIKGSPEKYLPGTELELLMKNHLGYLLVRAPDGYVGWVHENLVTEEDIRTFFVLKEQDLVGYLVGVVSDVSRDGLARVPIHTDIGQV